MILEKKVMNGFTPVDKHVMDLMLKEYYPTCRHIIAPEIKAPINESGEGLLLRTNLYIDHCYYGDGPGHFNATEFVVCFNQAGYLMIGDAIEKGMLPKLGMCRVEEFKEAQMDRCHIGTMTTKFRKSINPKDFMGEIKIERAKHIGGKAFYRMKMDVYDKIGGTAHAESSISITL